MKQINRLAKNRSLTMKMLEQEKTRLKIRSEYRKIRFFESTNDLLESMNPSSRITSLLNLTDGQQLVNKTNMKRSFSFIRNFILGYKLIKVTKRFLKKWKKKK